MYCIHLQKSMACEVSDVDPDPYSLWGGDPDPDTELYNEGPFSTETAENLDTINPDPHQSLFSL